MAPAAPLDDWLAAAVDHETIVVAPRMKTVSAPLARAIERARQNPTVRDVSDPTLDDLKRGLGFDLFTRGALAEAGFDVDGPLLLANSRDSGLTAVAVADGARVGAWLEQVTGMTPGTVGGQAGWRGPDGVALIADGVLYAAASEAALTALRAARADDGRDPVAGCPRARGAADLYVWLRRDIGRTCLTVRIDPGRIRLDARVHATDMKPADWLKPAGDLPGLRPDPAMALGINPGPALSATLSAALDPARAPFVGPLALNLGPGALDVLFALQPADASLLDRFVEAARGRPDVILDPARGGLRRIAVKPVQGQPAPPVSQIWLGTAHGRTWIGTDRAPIDRGPGAAPTTGLSADLFPGAGLTLYLRPGGLPHDGGPWADAVAPQLTKLGLDIRGLQDFAGAFAWLWAHVGELGLAVRPDGARWRISIEAVTL